jgi:hypothetical protein
MTTVPLARSSHEALLHMDLTPCPCGGQGADTDSVVVDLGDGRLGRRYTRTCHACGLAREFLYRLPDEPPEPTEFAYGGPEPSQLIDAAQWLSVADRYARAVPAKAGELPPDQLRAARGRLAAAVAALDEVVKFVPPGADGVPSSAVWTPMGRAVAETEAARLSVGRLSAVRAAYVSVLSGFAGRDDLTGRDLGDAAAALTTYRELASVVQADARRAGKLERALASWARRHSIDDRDWTEDGWSGDDRRRPTAEQAWEMVREAREIMGGPEAVDEPSGTETTYFARLRPGKTVSSPSWLLRRVVSGQGTVDELLGRDGQWRSSEMLVRAERGELPGTVKRVSAELAQSLVRTAQWWFGGVRRALDRQRAGEFVLRLAVPGTGSAFGEWDAEAQAEVVAFLTRAPVVVAGPSGTYRTDGMWVWPESIADQVLASGAPPEDLFFYHIEAREYFSPETVAPSVIERARRLLEVAATADGTERVQETNVPGQPPPPSQEERQRALGAWHADWQRKHAATTPFRPERFPGDPDYDQHYVDVEASPEADWEYTVRAREIMGLDPETGQRVDL